MIMPGISHVSNLEEKLLEFCDALKDEYARQECQSHWLQLVLMGMHAGMKSASRGGD